MKGINIAISVIKKNRKMVNVKGLGNSDFTLLYNK